MCTSNPSYADLSFLLLPFSSTSASADPTCFLGMSIRAPMDDCHPGLDATPTCAQSSRPTFVLSQNHPGARLIYLVHIASP
ncbi:hypothetical protein C8J57DRAFT_1337218 [Mycena rebaudengoi]|nr:hypothetical protein C8J57DRAFT_1337218 [Mycena rebaudengoi]